MSSNEFAIFQKNTLVRVNDPSECKMVIADNEIDETFNKFVEEVFHFTLKPSFEKEYDAPVIYLPDILETLESTATKGSELEILRQAVFERTLLSDPKKFLLKIKNNISIPSHTTQKECIVYLFKCFVDMSFAKQENRYPSVEENIYSELLDFISTNICTALKQPDLYAPQNMYEQVYFNNFFITMF